MYYVLNATFFINRPTSKTQLDPFNCCFEGLNPSWSCADTQKKKRIKNCQCLLNYAAFPLSEGIRVTIYHPFSLLVKSTEIPSIFLHIKQLNAAAASSRMDRTLRWRVWADLAPPDIKGFGCQAVTWGRELSVSWAASEMLGCTVCSWYAAAGKQLSGR